MQRPRAHPPAPGRPVQRRHRRLGERGRPGQAARRVTPPFRGVGVALVTLFDERGGLDAGATADHAARLVELGVAAVVVAGSTGEAAALD
ncbi:MAG: dihydrodipicolinate synthase family protein, partial [Acidimicrobiales bacterium]